MKHTALYLIAVLALFLTGCKQDNWIDWKLENELWLRQNLNEPGVRLSPTGSGLQYKVISQGNTTDARPNSTSYVIVDYKGTFINGKTFDSGENTSFNLSQVVEGFAEGLKLMNVHGDYVLFIPWELGYGDNENESRPSSIPPYSTLIFEVHLSAVSN